MQTPTLRPLASGELPPRRTRVHQMGSLATARCLLPLSCPKLNNDTNNKNASTLPCIAIYTGLWHTALYIPEVDRMSRAASNTMVGLSTAPLHRFYAPPLQAPGGWYMSLWAKYVLVPSWYSANLTSS